MLEEGEHAVFGSDDVYYPRTPQRDREYDKKIRILFAAERSAYPYKRVHQILRGIRGAIYGRGKMQDIL